MEVRYAETDQMGVVHHAAYLVWFELARTHHCRLSGKSYAEIEAMGYILMVTGAHLRYRRSARYGDTVRILCWLAELGSRMLRFEYEIRRGEELLTRGATEHVWVERTTGKPCSTPEPLRAAFEGLAGGV